MHKVNRYSLLLLICLVFSGFAWGQDKFVVNYDILLLQLEEAVQKGNPRALRELAGILEEPTIKDDVLRILERHTIFPTSKIRINSSLTRSRLFHFLNEHGEQISFSPLMRVFHYEDLVDENIQAEIKLRKSRTEKEKAQELRRLKLIFDSADEETPKVFIQHQFRKISDLATYEGFEFLKGCLRGENLPPSLADDVKIKEHLCLALSQYEEPEVLDILLEQFSQYNLDPALAESILESYTNVEAIGNTSKEISGRYYSLLDSLSTLSDMRMYGYESKHTSRLEFFEESVDYYALMMSELYEVDNIRKNAMRDILSTGNPRILPYLASIIYANKENDFIDVSELELFMDKIINIELKLRNGLGENITLLDADKDNIYYLNLVRYWNTFYTEYEFSFEERKFINTRLYEESVSSASRLFKKLTSENSQVALDSYRKLVQFSPSIIARQQEKYQSILLRSNKNLPDFKYDFLLNLSILNEFCENEKINLKPNQNHVRLYEELRQDLDLQKRYGIENELIEGLGWEDITFLEMEALFYSNDTRFNLSVSRILDVFYSSHLNEMLEEEDLLRLFLKKSIVFGRIGTSGVCNKYISKLEYVKDRILPTLMGMSPKEYDIDVRDAISQLIPQDDGIEFRNIPMNQFLAKPLDFDERDLQWVEKPKKDEISSVFKRLNGATKEEKIAILSYLNIHSDIYYTPHLIKLLDKQTLLVEKFGHKRMLVDDAVLMLENIHEYSFAKDDEPARESANDWKDLSKREKDYRRWKSYLFMMNMKEQLSGQEITADLINDFTESDQFEERMLGNIFDAFSRLESPNELRRINFIFPLSVNEHWKYFEKLDFKKRYINSILSKFEPSDNLLFIPLVLDFIKDESLRNQGKILSRFCELEGMMEVLGKEQELSARIKTSLQTYVDESSMLSEFEEVRVQKIIFELGNSDNSIIDKLSNLKKIEGDTELRIALQENILNQMDFNEIKSVLDNSRLLVSDGDAKQFLESRFGFPVKLFLDKNTMENFKKDLSEIKPEEVYLKYLKMDNLDLETSGNIDYSKIREILEYDIVSPFSGSSTQFRIRYATGIMELLHHLYPEESRKIEGEKQGINGGVREKSRAWLRFLEQKGEFTGNANAHSFNYQS